MLYDCYMDTPTIPGLLSVEELAEVLERHPEHVRRITRQGRVPGAKKVLGRWFYDQKAIQKWIASGRQDPDA